MSQHNDETPMARYINTESRGLQTVLVCVLAIIAVSAFILGAGPLIEIGQDWAGLSIGFATLIPVVLDAAAVAAAVATLVRRARGQRGALEQIALLLTIVISCAAQIVHAYTIESGWTAQTVVVACILGSAPLITLLASHIALRALVQPPTKRGKSSGRAATKAPTAAPRQATPKRSAAVTAPPRQATHPPLAAVTDAPQRRADELPVAYAARLHLDHSFSQRRAAEVAGTTRAKLETVLRQRSA